MKPEIVESVVEMCMLAKGWSFSSTVALVPTMGALHEGHLTLVREAASKADKVIVSIFVNPLQFGPTEDFSKYPRDLYRDAHLLREVGANVIFAPDVKDITPEGMSFSVDPGPMGAVLCGKYRPMHFNGVCTIVTKLFQIIRPGMAFFGWKDAQQFLLLRKMTADLNIPVKLYAVETAREPDGLAMSSRNLYLNEAQRKAAAAIFNGLNQVRAAYEGGLHSTSDLLNVFRKEIKSEPLLAIQFVEAVALDTLHPVQNVQKDKTLVAAAVFAGQTRLIDNIRL